MFGLQALLADLPSFCKIAHMVDQDYEEISLEPGGALPPPAENKPKHFKELSGRQQHVRVIT